MTGLGGIVDVAIGMSFMYLLLSLICTGLNELVSWTLSLRAATLKQGIEALLSDDEASELVATLYAHPLLKGISQKRRFWSETKERRAPSYIPSRSFVLALLDTLDRTPREPAAILKVVDRLLASGDLAKLDLQKLKECREGSGTDDKKTIDALRALLPELSDSAAKKTLAMLLGNESLLGDVARFKCLLSFLPPESSVKRQLSLLIDETENSMAEFQKRAAGWFDDAMERVGGLYKRRAQLIALVLGFAVAGLGGVDSGLVADALLRDSALRQSVATAATTYVKERGAPQPPGASGDVNAADVAKLQEQTKQLAAAVKELEALNLPIGWSYILASIQIQAEKQKLPPTGTPPETKQITHCLDSMFWVWLWRILGMLATALALAFGAPFWFDMLSKLANLRSSGPVPEKAGGERSK